MTELERFERLFVPEPNTGCWLWLGTGPEGYGTFKAQRRWMKAHRWAYENHVGPLAADLDLDHLCRVRCCVNPRHLEPVTRGENVRRGVATKLSPEQVLAIRADTRSFATIAKAFGTSPTNVGSIKRRISWRHLSERQP